MKENFEWFVEHYDEIYQLCGECHVVIKDKRIIYVAATVKDAYHWVVDNNLLGSVNISHCNGDESGYTAYIFTPFY